MTNNFFETLKEILGEGSVKKITPAVRMVKHATYSICGQTYTYYEFDCMENLVSLDGRSLFTGEGRNFTRCPLELPIEFIQMVSYFFNPTPAPVETTSGYALREYKPVLSKTSGRKKVWRLC